MRDQNWVEVGDEKRIEFEKDLNGSSAVLHVERKIDLLDE